MNVEKLEDLIKKEATKLDFALTKSSEKIRKREAKTVTRTFNKLGIVVPYNKRYNIKYFLAWCCYYSSL